MPCSLPYGAMGNHQDRLPEGLEEQVLGTLGHTFS